MAKINNQSSASPDKNNHSNPPHKKFMSDRGIVLLGTYLVIIGILLIQNIGEVWPSDQKIVAPYITKNNKLNNLQDSIEIILPHTTNDGKDTFLNVNAKVVPKNVSNDTFGVKPESISYKYIFFKSRPRPISTDSRLILITLLVGALGSWLHAISSYVAFVGNRNFVSSWAAWYVLRPIIGAALALIFYMAIRAGLFPNVGDGTSVSPYSIAAFAGLVGLFTERATKKLREVFDVIFTTKDKDKDPLGRQIRITEVTPDKISIDSSDRTVTVQGEDFLDGVKLMVNGKEYSTIRINDTKLKFELTEEDVKAAGKLEITLINSSGQKSNAFELNVVTSKKGENDANPISNQPQVLVPTISEISPSSVKVGTEEQNVIIKGTNFEEPEVLVEGSKRDILSSESSKINFAMNKTDMEKADKLNITVKNTTTGKESTPKVFEVTI